MVQCGKRTRNTQQPYPVWFRSTIVGYALFLACGLPFICWGALADPGHPHGGPHLVFTTAPGHADHVQTKPVDPRLQALLASDCGSGQVGFAPPPELAAALGLSQDAMSGPADAPAQADRPAGQSLPDSLLALLLAVAVAVAVVVRLRSFSIAAPANCWTAGIAPRVPTPPPRLPSTGRNSLR